MIEITTIGAGGGSIASVDAGGLLEVGPESAGSRPGPVAYAQGNDRPTLTDANIVLGRINAERPIGGKLARLDREAARAAISSAHRRAARPVAGRSGRGDRARRQRQDGGRHPARLDRARP
jgi:N-methylhydantoinase A/oxoprolinase/acetone carboxylase beta subunit